MKRGVTLVANLLVRVGLIAYHLIEFSREALRGQQIASFYSARARQTMDLSV